MADLIATGKKPTDQWKFTIPPGEWLLLGRGEGPMSVHWDKKVSRQHAKIRWVDDSLEVRRLETGRNAIVVGDQEIELDQFKIKPGESFRIGGTRFTLADDQSSKDLNLPAPILQRSYAIQEIQQARYRDADHRIDVLSRLPTLISGVGDDQELFVRLVNMLLAGIPRAEGIALVAVEHLPGGRSSLDVLHWERRRPNRDEGFRPSEQLILESMRQKKSVSHIWTGVEERLSEDQPEFTMTGGVDWAFCTPVLGERPEGWGIYVFGRLGMNLAGGQATSGSPDLLADLKFTELVASILASLRQVKWLQRKQAVFNQFFAPIVIKSLADEDPEVLLKPRKAPVSVLFCDLRGFSRESERLSHDLLGLLDNVSKALGLMTNQILAHGGVIGDFQGDAAMGFWGWPKESSEEDSARQACLAALKIRSQFEAIAGKEGDPLANFKMGIGIASGFAVAGKIGTVEQVKVSVFGPVVNLASRIEGMTKFLHATILLDEATARLARPQIGSNLGRFRRLAKIKPYGMEIALEVTELLPTEAECPAMTDEHIKYYESALDALYAKRWSQALAYLDKVPSEDQVKDFLTVFIAEHNRIPPRDWEGVIDLKSKN